MSNESISDIARQYCVSDIPGATIPGSRLSTILESMFHGRPLSGFSLKYLEQQHLTELHLLATGQIDYEAFVEASNKARKSREEAAEVERLAHEAKRLAREAEWAMKFRQERAAADAARIARESDPKYIARNKNQALREKYGMGYIEEPVFPRMMDILKRIDSGKRLTEDEVVWLNTAGKEYFTDELREAYHLIEAEFFAGEYRRNQDPWSAVNASGHFRKGARSERALELLDSVSPHRLNHPKIHSAMCTTRGGVMRDLGRLIDAQELGEQGHRLMPRDFRPCTLLGAVHMELGNFSEARDWYTKAEERGASLRAIDSDLRSIFMRADTAKREAIKTFLLAEDPVRYRWVNGRQNLGR
jgi:tetratricopeptide (TPR) repeat protein